MMLVVSESERITSLEFLSHLPTEGITDSSHLTFLVYLEKIYHLVKADPGLWTS